MSSSSVSNCPSCGAPASGRFCGSCGAALAGRSCPACQAPLAAGARFCGACGASTTGRGAAAPASQVASSAAATPQALWPFAIAGVAVIIALVVLLMPKQPVPAAAGGGAAGAASAQAPLPDLTALPMRVRFDTLYNRVMRAAEQSDAATAGRFAPMALDVYSQLEGVDADARYHAAMIRIHTGDPAGAAALADTISMGQPTHLFGYVIRGTVARLQREDAKLAAEQAAFLKAYDAEIATAKPEYADHKFILDQFVGEARARAGQAGGGAGGSP